ncbi:GPI mannosyltransferase 2 [Auxenochlorella protothecoides]|uniref:GPI mannosyltransferase 2 n=1 Tax=Auxenochlorella protothecoides TaxID=3075 RepID=A0A087SIS3_AUXPR|nr:GPI mannosyltransferase 2 [Auxenochlorella protothecoides]KFM25627.1 GPI mannosyltransferase 2 [Auxenochlorella protothecoides]
MASKTTKLLGLAALSRALVLVGIVLSDAAFVDLDTSASQQNRPCDRQCSGTGTSCLAGGSAHTTIFDDVSAWDSVFFVRVAKCGYETDMINAFFPLLPLVMRLGSAFLLPLHGLMPLESLLTLAGLLVNIAAFSAAALALWRLSVQVLGDERWADAAVLFFCINPASVFYSAAYTESLFAAFTFWGMLLVYTNPWTAVAAFTLAAMARSNGILGCWFLMHALLSSTFRTGRVSWTGVLRCWIGCLTICAPYALMQGMTRGMRGYLTYCGVGRDAALQPPPWCQSTLPSLYGYVQRQYWDVGFLRFYSKLDRWPKVLQSIPVAALSFAGCWTWACADWACALSLGMARRAPARPLKAPALAPYIYHWALMTAVAATAMHVNVATRFLSSCPPLYWYAAAWIKQGRRPALVLWGWALAFTVLGTLLLPNFYPWT